MYNVKSGLRKALYMYSATPFSRFENEEYSSCFALWGMHFLSMFVSRDIICIALSPDSEKHYICIALLRSHALRTRNIHRVLRFGACISLACLFPRAIHGSYEFGRISATPFSRFENEEYSSCFALWGMHFLSMFVSRAIICIALRPDSEKHCICIALLRSHALRTRNIHRVLRFGECISLACLFPRAIHGSYEFGRIIYHLCVNIYAVHQLYDS